MGNVREGRDREGTEEEREEEKKKMKKRLFGGTKSLKILVGIDLSSQDESRLPVFFTLHHLSPPCS